jgi:hypothetical protein
MRLFERCEKCGLIRLVHREPGKPDICDQCRSEMPQENCDTGRRIHPTKQLAEADDALLNDADHGIAERCKRCKGWHAASDRPKSRRGPTRRQRSRR